MECPNCVLCIPFILGGSFNEASYNKRALNASKKPED